MRSGKLVRPSPAPGSWRMVLPHPVTVASRPGRSSASVPVVASLIGWMPVMGVTSSMMATSFFMVFGFQRG